MLPTRTSSAKVNRQRHSPLVRSPKGSGGYRPAFAVRRGRTTRVMPGPGAVPPPGRRGAAADGLPGGTLRAERAGSPKPGGPARSSRPLPREDGPDGAARDGRRRRGHGHHGRRGPGPPGRQGPRRRAHAQAPGRGLHAAKGSRLAPRRGRVGHGGGRARRTRPRRREGRRPARGIEPRRRRAQLWGAARSSQCPSLGMARRLDLLPGRQPRLREGLMDLLLL
mmetsp:Transcript_100701/g.285393  ORF Transcript_100701/g.285393 Transcript_100701/m.285393 type:complete len:223 (-) Transcript_100701:1124-1792(-)